MASVRAYLRNVESSEGWAALSSKGKMKHWVSFMSDKL
jgi:hypothetical protein